MKNNSEWWKSAVIYQIYPRSFQDSNGDGIGDLNGITARLPYLANLGVDALWLCPVYRSPMADNGYDISDYCDIDPVFGTMADMETLIAEAKKRGIRIVMDLVLNHSSDEHPWFIEAKKSRDNPYHDYYVWRDGEPSAPPNDMGAIFGGSAWEWVPECKQYYYHQFAVKQPDLNWENPALRQALYEVVNFWIDKGVGGFRLDAIDLIAREPDIKITNNGPMLHAYLREMTKNTYGGTDLVTVGETWGANTKNARFYSNPNGNEFSMVFQFEHSVIDQIPGKAKWDLAPLDLLKLKQVLSKWQTELHGYGWNSLFWNNHDTARIVSRWGNDGEYRVQSAKMLAMLLHGLQGTPYIYEGEELGMTNVRFPSIHDYNDLETLNIYDERRKQGYAEADIMASIYAKSRDNARTPMQWDATPNAGFTTAKPWLGVNPNYKTINAAAETQDEDSVFACYKALIALRKKYPVFVEGDYELLCADDPDVFAYRRNLNGVVLTVICNFHGNTVKYSQGEVLPNPAAELLLANYPDARPDAVNDTLRPYEARMYLSKAQG